MAIIRRGDPFAGLLGIQRDLDDVFSDFLGRPGSAADDNLPTMDIYNEDDKELVVEVHLPGFRPEETEVKVQDNVLEISGQHQEEIEDRDRKRTYMMRQSAASFYRTLVLPKNIDAAKLQADFENGVLKIRAPFKEEAQSKKVTVNVGQLPQGRKSAKDTAGSQRPQPADRRPEMGN